MITKHHTLEQMRQRGIVAVLRSESEDQAIRVADACVAGGVGVLEVTFSVPAADRVIAAVVSAVAAGLPESRGASRARYSWKRTRQASSPQ